jgi:DNA-binding CsgD family transcriptional regulator
MIHGLLVYSSLAFLGGIYLFVHTQRQYWRTGDPLLLAYAYYLLAVNATVFESVIVESAFVLFAQARGLTPASIEATTRTLCVVSVPLLFLCWYLYLRLIERLTGRSILGVVWIGYLVAQLFALGAFALMIVHFASPPSPASSRAVSSAFSAVVWAGAFIRCWILIQVWLGEKAPGDAPRRKALHRFVALYAGLLIAGYGGRLLSWRPSFLAGAYLVIYLSIEYIPFFYRLAVRRGDARDKPSVFPPEHAADRLAAGHGLTEREREILNLLLSGKNNVEIHQVLFISPGTVRNYVSGIYRKLGVNSRYHLIALAHRGGTLPGNRPPA